MSAASERDNGAQQDPGLFERLKDAFNFKNYTKKQLAYTLAFLAIVGLMAFLYVYTFLVDLTFLTRIIVTLFVIPVLSIGWWGIPLYFGIMLVQCVVAPIPSELVQVVGGLIFGFWTGTLLSFTGIMMTAFVGFTIASKGGAPVIEKAIGEKNVELLDRFISRYGIWAIIVGRLVPFIPFDLITYGSGLVHLKKRDFVVGTAIGTVPRSFFYAYIGSILFPGGAEEILAAWNAGTLDFEAKLDDVSGPFNLILTLTLLIVGGGFLVVQFVVLPWARKKAAKRTAAARQLSEFE
ncbi:MAG: hypothetical protein Kow0069_01870 [Promethearchaeota archaeon]